MCPLPASFLLLSNFPARAETPLGGPRIEWPFAVMGWVPQKRLVGKQRDPRSLVPEAPPSELPWCSPAPALRAVGAGGSPEDRQAPPSELPWCSPAPALRALGAGWSPEDRQASACLLEGISEHLCMLLRSQGKEKEAALLSVMKLVDALADLRWPATQAPRLAGDAAGEAARKVAVPFPHDQSLVEDLDDWAEGQLRKRRREA
ncbi:unnamed protein product [Effrenium voratum]|uniref:Uncharacterized protein n=1 Tax=Effrenium voratum TaxID=2562239 RepID=A0AA36JMT9_9DINO|nr:unnamed protein product [Effrenium voratum]